jgi:hypothetical protein
MRALEATILGSQAWQRSSLAAESSQHDTRNYARFFLRVLPADLVVDAISSAVGDLQVHAVAEPTFSSASADVQVYFRTFSRPERKLTCDCERSSEPTLRQAMLLLSDPTLQARITRAAAGLAPPTGGSLDESLDELFLRALSRWPDESERQAAREHVEGSPSHEQALADVLWSLINTREFITLH